MRRDVGLVTAGRGRIEKIPSVEEYSGLHTILERVSAI
jgi:hypothetical protein